MTLAEAARIWEETKRIKQEVDPKHRAAEKVLKAWFRRSNKNRRGNIGYALTTYQSLDTEAVREFLADDVVKFEVTRERETLSLLR